LYIYLYNVSFINVTGFYDCGEINHSDANTVLDSADFVCNISTSATVAESEDLDDDVAGSSGSIIYRPSSDVLDIGYTNNIREKWSVKISVDNESHYVKIQDVILDKVLVRVSSEIQEKWLSVGEEWLVEVSGDDTYDVYVKVNAISGLYSNVTVRRISEPIEMVVPSDIFSSEVVKGPREIKFMDGTIDYKTIIILAVGIIILVVIFIIVFLIVRESEMDKRTRKNKKSVHKHKKRR